MNLKYKIGIAFLAIFGLISCAKHDQFNDHMELGQELPSVYWELGSTVCKAGNDVSFKVLYYPPKGQEIKNIEVWASVTRSETAAATVKLTSSLAYSKTVSVNDTIRRSQLIKTYDHASDSFDGYQYTLNATFPTSQTLTPISWVSPTEWDQEKFDTYYPETFQTEFLETVVDYLTKDSTYYNDLRHVYVNYDFKKEQFEQMNAKHNINFPTETETDMKSDLWYTDTEKVVGYYYITIENGISYYHEVADPKDAPEGAILYDVYDSSSWVFCRYSDDLGRAVSTVRPEYMPYLKDLISLISFPEWIYSSVDKTYTISFQRSYVLLPSVKVYNTAGKSGTDTDKKEVNLN